MLNHNVSFEFIGFDLEYDVKSFIISVADHLHGLAPSDSYMKVALKNGGDVVEASCRIASYAGVFLAEAVCNCPVAAIHQIEGKIKHQLDDWKKRRFLVGRIGIRSVRPHLEIAT